jgi:hypothetical protein
MSIPVFVSHPTPHLKAQSQFVEKLKICLRRKHLDPRTMGETNYDMEAPLAGIRRMMVGCCGLIAIAFRRSYSQELISRKGADLPNEAESSLKNQWLTSPYLQIEPAMAFQLGLPILILRERGVVAEGILERGVTGLLSPEFTLSDPIDFSEAKWQIISQWAGKASGFYQRRGEPPALF